MTQPTLPMDIQVNSLKNDLTDLDADDLSPEANLGEIDYLDWEARIAKLVGFEPDNLPFPTDSEDTANTVDSTGLEPSAPEPSEVSTVSSLSSNPFAKLGVVGAATFMMVLVVGLFLSQIMGGGRKSVKNPLIAAKLPSQIPQESHAQDLASEVEALKTKLALTQQAEEVKAAQQQLRHISLPLSQHFAPTSQYPNYAKISPKMMPVRIPEPARLIPQTAPVEHVAMLPHPPVPPTLPLPSVLPVKPEVSVTASPPPDPLTNWGNLAKLGSYGQVSFTTKPVDNYISANPTNANNPDDKVKPTPSIPLISQAETPNPKSVAVGTSAKAILATAVFGESTKPSEILKDDSKNNNKTVFVVQLNQPLKAIDGSIALPAKTQLLVEVASLSEQGLLKLNVTKIIQQNNGTLTEKAIPVNTITINAPQGKPLIAKSYPGHSKSIASMDAGLFGLGGIEKAAQLFNRTTSQVVTTPTGTVVSNTNPPNDVLAGVLEGGTTTIVPQISQRNQQAISQMTQRANLWMLPAGTAVEVYVNQPLQV